jgi:hypothetical protein
MFISLQFKLKLKKEDKEELIKLMRKQSFTIRVAYNMLKELEKEKAKNSHAQIYQRLRQLFPELPTRQVDSAISKRLASSEGSPPPSYLWKGLAKEPFSSEAHIGGRGVGKGEEAISSL